MKSFLTLFLVLFMSQSFAQVEHLKPKQNDETSKSTGGGNKQSTGGGNFASTGGGNGGETIDLNGDGYESLKDLVDKAVCGDPLFGYELAETLPEFKKIMKFLDQLHTDFANEMRRELTRVSICLSEVPLIKVNTKDENAVTLYHLDGNQTGVRINNEIYIDNTHFKKTYTKHKGYFLFHELLHGFISLSADRRNDKVKSFVKGVELLVDKKDVNNYPKMAHLIEKYQVRVPLFKNGLSCGYEPVSIPLRVKDCESKFGRYIHIDQNYEAVIGQNLLVKTENNEFKWELHLDYLKTYPEVAPAGYALNEEKSVTNTLTTNRLDSFYYTNANEWLYYDKNASAEYVENVKSRAKEYAEYAAKILQTSTKLDALVVDFNAKLANNQKSDFLKEVISNFNLPRYPKYEIAYAVNTARLIKLLNGSSFKLSMLDPYYAKSLLVKIYNKEHAAALKFILTNAKDLNSYKAEIKRFGVNDQYKNYFTNILK